MGPAGDKSPVGHRLRIVQLNGHALVQRVRHAHVQTMHRSNPVPLEGPPRFAHVALFMGSIGHLLQEFGGTRAHGPPCSEAHRQERVTQRLTDAPILAPLRVIMEFQPARRRFEVSVCIPSAVVVYMDVKLEGVCAGSTVEAFEDRQVGVEVTGAQAAFSMSAEGPDAPQGPGKGVAHLVVALTRPLIGLSAP